MHLHERVRGSAACVYTLVVCTRNARRDMPRGIVGGPSGTVSRIRRADVRPPRGRRNTSKSNSPDVQADGRRADTPPLFFSRAGDDRPRIYTLTTSERRRSQMRLRPAIWEKKRIRFGTWARVYPLSRTFPWQGEKVSKKRDRDRGKFRKPTMMRQLNFAIVSLRLIIKKKIRTKAFLWLRHFD